MACLRQAVLHGHAFSQNISLPFLLKILEFDSPDRCVVRHGSFHTARAEKRILKESIVQENGACSCSEALSAQLTPWNCPKHICQAVTA